jgi:trimeric autotransporter adhesin
MHGSRAFTLPSLVWLLSSAPGCSTVIGIDGDYTDLVAGATEQGGATGSGLSGSAGASAGRGGSNAQGGSTAQAGSNARGGGGGGAAKCSGVSSGGVCWHLGGLGDSCEETCSDRGGVAPDAPSFVGTTAQGGSLEKCATILDALGGNPAPGQATRSDDNGLGCHRYGLKSYWLSSPDFATTAHVTSARVVCGCLK